ncbi:MAG: DUF4390 domain-containing protein [Gemmatimonadota bacterium]
MHRPDLRRVAALACCLVLGSAGTLAGQDREVRVTVVLTPDTTRSGQRNPEVRTTSGLLEEDRWITMLRSGFPLRMHYRVEMWRSRRGWFDDLVRQVEWDVVVRHEPLLDQYAVNTIMPGQARENRYTGIDPLARALEAVVYRIAFRPPGPGEYYYVASLQVSTLSDSDLDELERFLRGDLGPAASEGRDLGDALGRGATRVLLKLAGVPSLRLEGRSERFRVK